MNQKIHFRYHEEQEKFILKSFENNQEIEMYVKGHDVEVYNMVVDGIVTRTGLPKKEFKSL